MKNILNIRSEITTSIPETRRGADALIIGRHFYTPVEDGMYYGITRGQRATGWAGVRAGGGVQFFVWSIFPKLL